MCKTFKRNTYNNDDDGKNFAKTRLTFFLNICQYDLIEQKWQWRLVTNIYIKYITCLLNRHNESLPAPIILLL